MTPHVRTILDMLDAGRTPVEIIRATGLSRTYVYAELRKPVGTRPRAADPHVRKGADDYRPAQPRPWC